MVVVIIVIGILNVIRVVQVTFLLVMHVHDVTAAHFLIMILLNAKIAM